MAPPEIRESSSGPRLFSSCALDRGDERVDVVVEQGDVVGRLFHAADRWRQYQDFGAGGSADRLWRLQIEVGFDENQLDVLTLHLLNDLEGVGGRGRGARF